MPSEIEASPNAHQATLSSTMIDLEEISNTQESPPRDTLSPADEASQAAFSSVSMNTEAKRMVDDLVGSESAEKDDVEETYDIDLTNGTKPTPLAPAFEVSSGRVDNETTYGFNSKLHGNDFAKILHEYSPPKTVQGSPRPHLPSIYGSAFAPETTPGSRPSTARRPSPHHSQQNSLYAYPPKSLSNLYDVDSTIISSMQDPSSLVNPQTPTNKNCYVHPNQPNLARCSFEQNFNYGAIGQPVSRSKDNPTDPADSDFPNSSVLEGSTWRSVRAIHEAMDFHTPPNGQGTG